MDRAVTGFTLVELLVTISIIAILAAIGMPSYQSTITGMRMNNEINTLSSDLSFARSEAIKRGQTVYVCPSSNGTSCNAANNWSTGWITYAGTTASIVRKNPGVTHSDTLNGYAAVTVPLPLTPVGYADTTGTISLHNATNDASLRRCVVFSTGAWKMDKGSNCP